MIQTDAPSINSRPAGKTLRAVLLIHLSNLIFAVTALAIGRLSGRFDGFFTSFARFAVGALIGFSQLALTRTPFRIHRFKPWLGRGIFGTLAMTLYYLSIQLGSAGRASLFNNSFPIFVALIAIFIIRETVRPLTMAGIAVAFSGVLVVLWEGSAGSGTAPLLANLAGLASGIFAGVSYHFNKRASLTEHPVIIYLSVCLVGMLVNAGSIGQLQKLDVYSAVLLLAAGLGAYLAQLAITYGLRDIDTTVGSIHTFAKIPLTVIAGVLFLGEAVSARFIAGTVLLLAGLSLNQLAQSRKADHVDR